MSRESNSKYFRHQFLRRAVTRIASMVFVSNIGFATVPSNTQRVKPSVLAKARTGYAALLTPLDIYAPPPKAKKLLTIGELYSLVRSRGIALKVSRETLNTARQTIKTENDKKLPTLSMDLAHQDSWTKTKSDSDPTDSYTDRDDVFGSRSINSSGGFTLSGTPTQGWSYKLLFPQLVNSQTQPDLAPTNPERPDKGAFTASTEISLIKNNPLLVEKLNQKKLKLTYTVARETFRSETLRAIAAAESSYYSLIQKYLQLAVQQRALLLAKALESDVKEKIAAGESSSLEAMRAELQSAQTETDLMSSEIDFEAAVEEFRNSLSYEDGEGQGIFPDPKSLDLNLEGIRVPQDAVNEIRRSNPDLAVSRIGKQTSEVDLELARKATLPSLGFSVSYGNAAPDHGWGRATLETLKPNDRTFSMGLTYTQILYNDTSNNALQQAIVAKQKAEYSVDQSEKKVFKEYNALVKKLEIGTRKLRIAKISREMAERKLSSEYEKFKVGESNVRNVIDSQTEVNSARISEIGARVELLTGMGQLRTLMGRLPEGHTISYSTIPDGGLE